VIEHTERRKSICEDLSGCKVSHLVEGGSDPAMRTNDHFFDSTLRTQSTFLFNQIISLNKIMTDKSLRREVLLS
jgi:hypothetical protein